MRVTQFPLPLHAPRSIEQTKQRNRLLGGPKFLDKNLIAVI